MSGLSLQEGSVPTFFLALVFIAASAGGSPNPAFAEPADPTGREIMQWVNDREDGDNETSLMEMVLIDKSGNTRVRRLQNARKDKGPDRMSLSFFLSPPDVKNTGFLSYDYIDVERDDDQWLYLPALKKTKRIAGGDRGGSFMGSDFSYADMSKPALDRYTYTLMKETTLDGVDLWQIEAVPDKKEQKETGYTRSIHFVRKDNHMLVRSVNFLKKGKRLKYSSVDKLQEIDGVWVATELSMVTKKGKKVLHKTLLRVSDVKFNQGLEEDDFSVRSLEKGI